MSICAHERNRLIQRKGDGERGSGRERGVGVAEKADRYTDRLIVGERDAYIDREGEREIERKEDRERDRERMRERENL